MSRLSCVSGCRCKAGWGEGLVEGGGLNWLEEMLYSDFQSELAGRSSFRQLALRDRQNKHKKNAFIVSQYGRIIVVYPASIVAIYDLGFQDCVKKGFYRWNLLIFIHVATSNIECLFEVDTCSVNYINTGSANNPEASRSPRFPLYTSTGCF